MCLQKTAGLRQFSQRAATRNWGDSQPCGRLNETQCFFVWLDVPWKGSLEIIWSAGRLLLLADFNQL